MSQGSIYSRNKNVYGETKNRRSQSLYNLSHTKQTPPSPPTSRHRYSSYSSPSNTPPSLKENTYESITSRTSKKQNYGKTLSRNSHETPNPSPPSNKLRYSRHSSSPITSPKKSLHLKPKVVATSEEKKKINRSLSLSNIPQTSSSSPRRSKSRLSVRSSIGSTPGSSEIIGQSQDIILRKVFKGQRWHEQREETTFMHKGDGTMLKRSKTTEAQLNNKDESELADSLSKFDRQSSKENMEMERSSQLFSRHGRGLIQDDQEKFSKEILTKINEFRVEHMVKSLKLNDSLCQQAREWTKYMAYSGRISFTNRHDVGESIFVKVNSQPYERIQGDDIVEKWYSEYKDHNYENSSDIMAANFTQLVWKGTKEIGAAIDRSLDGTIAYVVVYYYPKGNFPGDLVKNVPPIGGFASKERNEKGIIRPHVAEKDEGFLPAVMRAMNYYRLQHSAIPLMLDKSLTEYAQEWADQLALEDRVRSRPRNIYGENIYMSALSTSSDIPGQEPVEYWYKKKKFYNFTEAGDIRAAAFTQLVWQDTRDVGVGIAKSKTKKVYVVANFNPPGNLVAQFTSQVFPAKWK